MATLTKEKNVITDLLTHEVIALIKMNLRLSIYFNTGEIIEKDENQFSEIIDDNFKSIYQQSGIKKIIVHKEDYDKKWYLISIINEINKTKIETINKFIFDTKNKKVILNNGIVKGLPNEIHYYVDNDEILSFMETGPSLFRKKTNSILDILK